MTRGRVSRLGMAVALGVASLVTTKAATPGNVFACYCVAPETVAAYRTDADIVIVAGTLTGARTFRVERVYKGPVRLGPNDILVDTSSCGFPMKDGERWIIAARVFKGELRPSICDSRARVGGPGAAALLADIESAYGPQAPLEAPADADPGAVVDPGPAEPTAAAASTPQTASPTVTRQEIALPVILATAIVLVVLLFASVAMVTRRGRRTT